MASAAQHFEASSEDVENERNNTPKIFKVRIPTGYINFCYDFFTVSCGYESTLLGLGTRALAQVHISAIKVKFCNYI